MPYGLIKIHNRAATYALYALQPAKICRKHGSGGLAHAFEARFPQKPEKKFPIALFTKPLDGFELSFMTETLAMAGLDGMDLSVRPKGRVEPRRVADDLHQVLEAGKKNNLATDMMVTAITGADSPYAEDVLSTAAKHGVRHYRMGYLEYDFTAGIPGSLRRIRKAGKSWPH